MKKFALVAALTLFPGSAFAQASTTDPAPSTAGTDPHQDIVNKIQDLTAEQDYPAAIKTLDELLAKPNGYYNPMLQGWLVARYGDTRRAASTLLPLSVKKKEMERHIQEPFIPLILGSLWYAMGDRERARESLQKAVDTSDAGFAWVDFRLYVMLQGLDLLAQLHRESGEHRAALQCIERMRGLYKRGGIFRSFLPLADVQQAELALAKGDPALAERALKAVDGMLEAYPRDIPHGLRARAFEAKGILATRQGNVREAEKLLKDALTLREAIFHPSHPLLIQTLRNLSNLYVVMNKPAEAVAFGARAAELADKRARHLLSMGSERQKRTSARFLQNDTNAVVSLHLQYAPTNVTAARMALTAIFRRKGIIFEAMLGGITALRENLDDEGRALSKELTELSTRMSTMISRGPVDVTMEDFQADLLEFEERRHSLEERLAAHATRGRKSRIDDQPLLQLEDVQKAIPNGAALVELFEYRPYRPFGPPVHPTWGKPRLAAYVLRKTGDPTWTDLGFAHSITNTAKKLVEALAAKGEYRPLARQLDALVMQPLRSALGSARWILLSPDGALNFVPF